MPGSLETLPGFRLNTGPYAQIYAVEPAQMYAFLTYIAGPQGNPAAGQLNKGEWLAAPANTWKFGENAAGNPLWAENITYPSGDNPAATDAVNKAVVALSKQPPHDAAVYQYIIQPDLAQPPEAPDNEIKNAHRLGDALINGGYMQNNANGEYSTNVPGLTNKDMGKIIAHFVTELGAQARVPRIDSMVVDYHVNGWAGIADTSEAKLVIVEDPDVLSGLDGTRKLDHAPDNNHIYVLLAVRYRDKDNTPPEQQTVLTIPSSAYEIEIPNPFNADTLRQNIYDTFKDAVTDTWDAGTVANVQEPYAGQNRPLKIYPIGLWATNDLAGVHAQANAQVLTALDVLSGGPRAAPNPIDAGVMPIFKRLVWRHQGYQNNVNVGDPMQPAAYLSLLEGQAPANRNSILLSEIGTVIPEEEVNRIVDELGSLGIL